MVKCLLCQNNCEKLAKSHIFPIGFFNKLDQKGRLDTFKESGEKGRKLQKAIYDSKILCPSCEKKISVFDDYAIKVFRDKEGSFEVSEMKAIIFNKVDKYKLRGFIASLLWRISKSKQKEISSLSIDERYEDKIANDIINSGKFSYIDVFSCYLNSASHSIFLSPYEIMINPIDVNRDPLPVNGWEIFLPNLVLRVSLSHKSHPLNHYVKISPELTDKEKSVNASTSLKTNDDYHFMFMDIDKIEGYIRRIDKAYLNKTRV